MALESLSTFVHFAIAAYVKLLFLSLHTVEIAIAHVAARAAQGGHDAPESVIRRRYAVGITNFRKVYCAQVDASALYDNKGLMPVLLESGEKS